MEAALVLPMREYWLSAQSLPPLQRFLQGGAMPNQKQRITERRAIRQSLVVSVLPGAVCDYPENVPIFSVRGIYVYDHWNNLNSSTKL